MAEINDFEIIQNKLDALVVKIIQKENLDEDFRITYAQILEKINTKIDAISNTESIQQLGILSTEIRSIMLERKEIVDAKLNDLKTEFDEVIKLLNNSIKSPELLAAFDKIQNSLHFLSEGQNDYKKSTEILLTSSIESIKEVNNQIHSDIEEQLSYMKDITLTLRSVAENTKENTAEIKDTVENKVSGLLEKIENTGNSVNIMNQNLSTLIQIVGNIFEDEDFVDVKSDVSDILVKTALISEELKKIADKKDVDKLTSLTQKAINTIITKEQMLELVNEENKKIEEFNQQLIKNLEQKILQNLEEEANSTKELKNLSEKILLQGTEVLKDEVWNLKDKVNNIYDETLKEKLYQSSIESLKEEIIDTISTESVATSDQLNLISENIDKNQKESLSKINELKENNEESSQNIINSLNDVKSEVKAELEKLDEQINSSFVEQTENTEKNQKSIVEYISNLEESQNTQFENLDENININHRLTLNKLEELKTDITDIISEESVATSEQIKDVSGSVSAMRDNLIDLIAEESKDSSNQIANILAAIESFKADLTEVVLSEHNEQVNQSLQSLQSKFLAQLIQIAENISFEEEADDINDNIIECTNELKEKITESTDSLKSDILNYNKTTELNSEKILDILENVDDFVQTDVNQDLKTIVTTLKKLTNGSEEIKEYSYTMPDVESDLSKVRLDINNIQKILAPETASSDKEDLSTKINAIKETLGRIENNPVNNELAQIKVLFDNLSEDVSSISKRTNKLVLESDTVSKTLKSNITSFTSLMNDFYSSSLVYELKKKVDNISKSNEVINEAFMYLAEWVDASTETFNKLEKDLTLVQNNIEELENSVTEKVSRSLNALNQKIDEQEEKINILLQQQNENKEIKNMLEFIASQVNAVNEKADESSKISSKIASLEKQIKKIQTNVSLITEYLDEEEEESEEY